MSRIGFLYRAWNKIDKEMYTGLPYSNAKGNDTFDIVLKQPRIYTVMECTGVEDSDNVLVFEGDYLSDGETIWEVQYCKTMCGFSAKAVGGKIPCESNWFSLYHLCNGHNAGRSVHVVGNIYENKKPLKYLLKTTDE